ncbi:uncharacterized protein L969DRAFT_92119 [Mixia osmundae IAM 14324]|uniref:Sodium/hydrogen exchanger n=1 Tax=Mixia osmundae (strain CBS 9802 / IAM 14324 / JCM 22182 / KY 12970) TaxID=764103 RepID=G7E7B2_MIXOS|nr:uncharacterized protein L969DRAFT_92119 [Mixia osmundae IAM 14324]KEI42690.1 hypothetical protein L969DRAFT_92119 [Mixia osmundae IAM 14324]GAA98722.1 hypothetical protein E5Q_05410 [Mixia osmundae IAM 14324]
MADAISPSPPDLVPPPSTGPELDPETEELWSSRALLLVLLLLILSFWTAYYLKVRKIKSVHETIVATFAGMFVGFVIRVLPGDAIQGMLTFKSTIMLNVLLPPIILNSGFELRQENFFRNFGVILTFAFTGTFISAIVLGVLVYIWALLGLEGLSLTLIECLIYGTTLSATDPVTILAIFNALKVDPKLYSVIFGESILNDAVAIVMFETLSKFHGEKIHLLSFFHGVGIFLLTFCTSMALGVIFGLGLSLMLKHSNLAHYPEIESCLVTLTAYTSYFFSNGLTMSGIVSLLFCGITLKHYAYHNMSRRTQRATKYIFRTLAQLCENFIFIYLGLALFTQKQLVYKPIFILVTALAVCVARYAAVFPISKLINVVFKARGQRHDELPHSYQMMLFWAGLRGAVGVALAAGLTGDGAAALRTSVLVTVVLTVIFFGGTTGRMVEILGIRTGVDEEDDSSEDEGYAGISGSTNQYHEVSHAHNSKQSLQSMENGLASADDSQYIDWSTRGHHRQQSNGSRNVPYPSMPPRHNRHFSDQSIGEEDDETESPTRLDPDRADEPPPADGQDHTQHVWRDGQWFNVLDERFLLPVFSNATASRRQQSKKQASRLARHQSGQYGDMSLDEGDLAGSGADSPVNKRDSSSSVPKKDFEGTFSSVLSSLVSGNPGVSSSGVSAPSTSASNFAAAMLGNGRKRRESDDPASPGDQDDGSTIDLSLAGRTSMHPDNASRSRTSQSSSASLVPQTIVTARRTSADDVNDWR